MSGGTNVATMLAVMVMVLGMGALFLVGHELFPSVPTPNSSASTTEKPV